MNKYDEVLENQIFVSVFVIILIFILAITVFVSNKKHFFDDLGKTGRTLVNLFVVTILVAGIIHFSLRICHLYTDIHEQSYITYSGNFEVSSYNDRYVTLQSEGDALTLDGKVELPGGQYSGQIVYAKHSKYVLSWHVDYKK